MYLTVYVCAYINLDKKLKIILLNVTHAKQLSYTRCMYVCK